MSFLMFLVWGFVLFFGNILTVAITSTYGLGAGPVLWFNGVWVSVLIILRLIPYFKRRIKNRENF